MCFPEVGVEGNSLDFVVVVVVIVIINLSNSIYIFFNWKGRVGGEAVTPRTNPSPRVRDFFFFLRRKANANTGLIAIALSHCPAVVFT